MIFAIAAARWLHLAGLMLLFGGAALMVLLRARVPELAIESATLRRVRWLAYAVALAAAILWLMMAVGQMAGARAAALDLNLLWRGIEGTLFGQIFLVRLMLLLGTGAALARRSEISVAVAAGAALGLLAVTSHAAESGPPHFGWIGLILDAVHLLTAGFWVGSLPLLINLVALRAAAPRLAKAISVFAEWAMIAVALLGMTGLINAASIVLGGEGPASRLYLGVLGAKLVLVLAMTVLALANHFRLLPKLARPPETSAAEALKGNMAWELGLGLGVLLLAAMLGLMAPVL